MDSNSYPYDTLHGDQIRYLTVHAFDASVGIVQCSLHHGSLHDLDGKFTALSYVWGDAKVTEAIHLSGHPFIVTTNLATCLRQLATTPKYQEISIWVDAICINQHDVNERNAQVQRMGNIYSLAKLVIAWLGPGTRLSHIGMQRLQNINPSEIQRLQNSKEIEKEERRNEIFDELVENNGEEGLRELLSRPYWSRTWIVQEIRLGREAHLLCGNDEVTIEKLTSFFESLGPLLSDAGTEGSRPTRAFELMNRISEGGAFATLQRGHLQRIVHYVCKFKNHKCSDPRDKVYALLGITSDLDAERVIPDYGRSEAEVYGDVVETHLKSHDDLDFLRFAGNGVRCGSDMASWIPDWRKSIIGICRRTLVEDKDWNGKSPFMLLLPDEEGYQRSDGSVYTSTDTWRPCACALGGRRLAITSKGWLALAPKETEAGDYVSVLIGASMPFILRKAPSDGNTKKGSAGKEFFNVGSSYVHGLMDGKGLDMAELGGITLR